MEVKNYTATTKPNNDLECNFHTGALPLTNANDNKSRHSIQDAQVPHTEHNMV